MNDKELKKFNDIHRSRQYLKDTDYVIIKIQEYQILGKEIDNDYTEILQKREKARNTLRNLEV